LDRSIGDGKPWYGDSMDRAVVSRHLAMAEKHIAAGERDLVRQREVLLTLERGGQNTTNAEARLVELEEVQAIYTGHRDRLRQELNGFGENE
jgi:hypothetical protein